MGTSVRDHPTWTPKYRASIIARIKKGEPLAKRIAATRSGGRVPGLKRGGPPSRQVQAQRVRANFPRASQNQIFRMTFNPVRYGNKGGGGFFGKIGRFFGGIGNDIADDVYTITHPKSVGKTVLAAADLAALGKGAVARRVVRKAAARKVKKTGLS